MPVYRLDEHLAFPDPELAEDHGLLAVGGDLSPERLLLAYSRGIFPWYGEDLPILWHSPDPRMAMRPEDLVVNRTLRKLLRRHDFRLEFDTAFRQVIETCARAPRPGQDGTWIVSDMIDAYVELHRLGFAHSAEVFAGDTLVGGVYGVSLGSAFFGESMFATQANASKIAYVALIQQLRAWGFTLIDCQVHTEHLANFGATEWPRPVFLTSLEQALTNETRTGKWSFDPAVLATLGQLS